MRGPSGRRPICDSVSIGIIVGGVLIDVFPILIIGMSIVVLSLLEVEVQDPTILEYRI